MLFKIQLFTLFMLIIAVQLSAWGKKEEEKREPQNTEFILCITAFDVSALPPGQRILGSVLQRELAIDLGRINHRLRDEDELARYEELAWTAAMHTTAFSLAAKRAERDALLFQGTSNWKYRKELKRINRELKDLETAYTKAEEEKPLIEEKPLFMISSVNLGTDGAEGIFPPPPEQGGDELFLKDHNADAFLEGKFRLLFGRIYAEFRLFTRGASFIHEDSTIFSPEDLNTASDELKSRFLAAVVNSEPARLALLADPDYALLELNGRPVKSGETLELPPGPVIVRASADAHQSETKELELEGGTAEELSFVLKPFTMETLDITFPGPNSSVYMGALYLGGNHSPETEAAPETEELPEEADAVIAAEISEGSLPEPPVEQATASEDFPPESSAEQAIASEDSPPAKTDEHPAEFFPVFVPEGQYRYIRVDTEDGLTGEAIVKGSPGDEIRIVTLQPRRLPDKNDKPVDNSRRKFYGAYGRFWVTFPLAFFINGIYQMYYSSYYTSAYSSGNQSMYGTARNLYYVSIGAWAVTGIFLVESLIRMGIYISTSSKESIPLWE